MFPSDHLVPESREALRNWLAEHHATCPGIWLVFAKKGSGLPTVSYPDAVREALCFGWIDSRVASIDETFYKQWFSPRKPKSVWSRLNKSYVEELLQQGKIEPAGLRAIEVAQQNGSWESLDAVEALIEPDPLARALADTEGAREAFDAFPPSARRNYLQWLASAKTEPTRQKRIAEIVRRCLAGERLN